MRLVLKRSEEGVGSPGIEVTEGCEPPCVRCEPNPDPLEEQTALLTAEPPSRYIVKDDLDTLVSGSPLPERWGGRLARQPGLRDELRPWSSPGRGGAQRASWAGRTAVGVAWRIRRARWLRCQAVCCHGGALGVPGGGGFAHRPYPLPDSQPGSGGSR